MRTEIAWRTDENGMLLGPALHDSSLISCSLRAAMAVP